ncbi:MAG: hypothetical protein IKM21_05385 [Oscillospiraceae bacterium]|nr:hypothetical protein [Oscillospiraceae bacterium]
MNEKKLREELYSFYLSGDKERCEAFSEKCYNKMNRLFRDGMTVTEQKLLQYDVIAEEFEPVIFRFSPYFFETGVLTSLSDGSRVAKAYGFSHAGAWVFDRNCHLFEEQDPELFARRTCHIDESLYLICGCYNDTHQHFNLNSRPFLTLGAKGICEKAERELANAKNDDEREFLRAVCHGMLTLRRMAEKFSEKAKQMLEAELDCEARQNLSRIAECAARVPWEAPKTLYEALATLAFLRCAVGSIEGIGMNSFGRLDRDLIPFYRADVESGRLTYDEAYDLIAHFLLIWDCHYDHDMIMEWYADHELENTYTLGGCDEDGEPIYNEITELFLRANREKKIIFPKIKCRFSKSSPKEYLDEINRSIIKGTTTVLLQNDDATIPALIRAGRSEREARDYYVAGCWDIVTNQERADHGDYLNLLKPFEYAVHNLNDRMERVGITFETFDGAESFEEVYERTLRNCEALLDAKLEIKRRGGQIFHKVDSFPIFSSTIENCIENHLDYTLGGAKYYDDYQLIFGLPNIVDSLMAIKTLVFDKKKYTLSEFLSAVRRNWADAEDMRADAVACHGWGDGEDDSTALAARFNADLFEIFGRKEGSHGGRVHMGHLTYTEIRWWGEKTLATPDGRRNGEYFAQGLTPSRLKRIPCVNDVIRSLAALDGAHMAANSVVNIILPPNIPLERAEGFLRAIAQTATQSLQLNCTSKEELLDAQKHPEKYPDLIVRVTGFSAKFTSLSRGWQDEVITRNFYD